MSSILVTGGAGFIGSNVCRDFLLQGHRVWSVDNFITGTRENITPLLDNPLFSFVEMDVTDPAFVEVFADKNIDQIYHLACPTGVPNISILGEEMLKSSSYGTFNVLEIAKHHEARLIYSSSAEVYGDPERFPQDESYAGNVDPVGPRSAYEEAKRFSEAVIAMAVRRHSIDGIIVRLFNTYGPGMSLEDTRVIPRFLKSIKEGRSLRIYGDGSQTRSHMYVDDTLNALKLLMEKGKSGEVYNIGSSKEMTIRAVAELLIEITGHSAGIVYEPHFILDHGGRRPATEKLRALGWSPAVTMEEGLRRMVEAYEVVDKAEALEEIGAQAQEAPVAGAPMPA